MCQYSYVVAFSIKLQVSFAKETYKRDAILQKRPIFLSHVTVFICVGIRVCQYSYVSVFVCFGIRVCQYSNASEFVCVSIRMGWL